MVHMEDNDDDKQRGSPVVRDMDHRQDRFIFGVVDSSSTQQQL